MSEYCNVKTEFKDQEALIMALSEMKNARGQDIRKDQIEIHSQAQNLVGYGGDIRADKANIIIRRRFVGDSSNDLGFVKNADGTFTAIVSAFDKRHYNEAWQNSLKQNYAFNVIKLRQEKMGRTVTRERLNNGVQRVRINGYR